MLVARLGAGGMGEVFLARHRHLSPLFAVKVLMPALLGDPEFLTRFFAEADQACRVRHANVVRVLTAGTTEPGAPYLAMDFVDGASLSALLALNARRQSPADVAAIAPVSPAAVVDIGRQAARGLAAIHACGVIHRDIKPGNVLVSREGVVQITDFGVARRIGAARMTTGRAVIGTPRYISPEQWRGERGDERSDLYALGVTLFQMLTGGAYPVDGGNDMEIGIAASRGERLRLPEAGAAVPGAVGAAVERLIETEPEDRFQSADEAAEALEFVLDHVGARGPARQELVLAVGRAAVDVGPLGGESDATYIPEAAHDATPADVSRPSSEIDAAFIPIDQLSSGELTPPPGSGRTGSTPLPELPAANPPPPDAEPVPPPLVLPRTRTGFIGRKAELGALAAAATQQDAAVSTIVGPGGTGKTRLAIEFAAQIHRLGTYPAGVYFAEISHARRIPAICGAVASALHHPLTDDDPHRQVADELARRAAAFGGRLLLVLDNAEQAVDAVAECIVHWQAAVPPLRAVVTSREALRVDGEVVLPLNPLGLPTPTGDPGAKSDAVALFLERAAAAAPRFSPTPTSLRVIADICRLLDGVPLAIELAAAQVRSLPPARLLELLQAGRFDVIGGTRRAAEPRQTTLMGAIEWSWNLLDSDEQRALAILSLFRNGFDLECAEQLLTGDPAESGSDAAALVMSLVEKSLIHAWQLSGALAGEWRYRMFESIRAFAVDRRSEVLTPDDDQRARQRLIEVLAGYAERWEERISGADGTVATSRIGLELDNLFAAAESAGPALVARIAIAVGGLLRDTGPFGAAYPGALDALTQLAMAQEDDDAGADGDSGADTSTGSRDAIDAARRILGEIAAEPTPSDDAAPPDDE
jgi:predicted ATPase